MRTRPQRTTRPSRRALRVVLPALLLALAVAAPPAKADHGGGCGGAWSGSRTCVFYFRGLPVTTYGDSQVSSGTASVTVRVDVVRVDDETKGPTLTTCTASRAGFATCEDELGVGRTADSTKQITLLTCSVQGRGSGQYYCSSGLGI